MDNDYLLDLIVEAQNRGGGFMLNLQSGPAAVVLTVDKYNQLLTNNQPETKTQTMKKNVNSKKVLVTGGAGYIGGHLVHELIKAGYQVTVLDNLSTGRRENIDAQATFIEGDLADENLLKDVFAAGQFEAVFHMAASLEVEESVKEPEKYLNNNVLNTAKLLAAMNEAGCKRIVFSSTAAVYGNDHEELIAENSQIKPNNPYGATKLLSERVIKYYCEYLGFQGVVFRYFNACGTGEGLKIVSTHSTHLLHNILEVAAGHISNLKVFGDDYPTFDGTCVRDYIHVSDIALPHILAFEKMEHLGKFEIFNIGTGKGFSVLQMANAAAELLNKIIPMEISPRREGDAIQTVADNSRLIKVLGYHPSHSSLDNIVVSAWEGMKE